MSKRLNTNPLNPEFPEKVAQEQETSVLPEEVPETHPLFRSLPTEEVTRTLDADFPGVNTGETAVLPKPQDQGNLPSRKIPGLLFSERVLTSLSYLPYLGLVVSGVVLLRTSRTEGKLRFHSAQALAAHLLILLVGAFLGFVNHELAKDLFELVTTIMLLVFVFRAWQDRPIHIEAIEPLTELLEEKLSRDVRWG
jgi:uncharacterized membrane protein